MGIGDIYAVLVIFTIIGRLYAKVHKISVIVMIMVRAAWIILQLEMVVDDKEYMKEYFDYSSW